ncbi:MAG: response regulator transcription factor [Coprococcus sp.]
MGAKILIADDDIRINDLLCEIFQMEGYETISAKSGTEVIEYLERGELVELIVLDVMMPGFDGWEVLDYVKERFDVKILMLTALTSEMDEVKSLQKGADDYVAKPFKRAVLLERARRLITEWKRVHEQDYVCGDLRLSQVECKVYFKGEELKLTVKEYKLLLLLMQNSKIVLSRELILEKVWGIDYEGNDRVIDTHIKMLRQSLGEAGEYIRTVRGVGYSFDDEVM